jgi:hypothetical protein
MPMSVCACVDRTGKLADAMCSVRTSSIGLDEAHDYARSLYPQG